MHLSLIADLVRRRVWLAGIGDGHRCRGRPGGGTRDRPRSPWSRPIFIIELPLTLVLAALANHNREAPAQTALGSAIGTTTAGPRRRAGPIAQPSGANRHRLQPKLADRADRHRLL